MIIDLVFFYFFYQKVSNSDKKLFQYPKKFLTYLSSNQHKNTGDFFF